MLRANLVEAGEEDYIRTARAAKGLSETRILIRHALRTSLVTIVTLFGLDFGALVGGSALLHRSRVWPAGHRQTDLARKEIGVCADHHGNRVMYASFFVVLANGLVDVLCACSTRGCAASSRNR